MAIVIFNHKNMEDIKKELIEILERNGWNRKLEYDWDTDTEIPVNYNWEINTPKGFRNLTFAKEDSPNSFKFIEVEDWMSNSDKEPINIGKSKITTDNISNVYIDNYQIQISMDIHHSNFIAFN